MHKIKINIFAIFFELSSFSTYPLNENTMIEKTKAMPIKTKNIVSTIVASSFLFVPSNHLYATSPMAKRRIDQNIIGLFSLHILTEDT